MLPAAGPSAQSISGSNTGSSSGRESYSTCQPIHLHHLIAQVWGYPASVDSEKGLAGPINSVLHIGSQSALIGIVNTNAFGKFTHILHSAATQG
jgi:hypothetical protein